MTITVNGSTREIDRGACVADLLPSDPAGIAVALNGEVVPRGEHASTALTAGDVVEIVTAVQGG